MSIFAGRTAQLFPACVNARTLGEIFTVTFQTLELKILQHRNFPQPSNIDEKVWRYLSLSKFLDFFLSESLYFSRIDLLQDICEGTYTKRNTDRFPFGDAKISSGVIQTQEERTLRSRKSKHVNCWRIASYESEAMWKLYCPNNEGLAIQTTYKKLAISLPEDRSMYMGLVTYLDYESESFDTWNSFSPAMHKRIAFEHEKEVRIVKSYTAYMNDHNLPEPEVGIKIKTTLLENIDCIYINPYAEQWYFDTINSLFEKLNIKIPLNWSEIKAQVYY